jgi:S1-C subfamily serine protease
MSAAIRIPSHARAVYTRSLAIGGLLVSLVTAHQVPAGAQPPVSRSQVNARARSTTARKPATENAPRRAALPADDWTYRPTVVVRRGTSQGSGTIIASVEGETLVLTAAHVLKKDKGPVWVELHRYNLGMERRPAAPGVWPRVLEAAPAASDPAADVAVVRVEKLIALPYVARLAPDDEKPQPGFVVSSVGIDLGRKLSLWSTRVVETVAFELNESRESRPFLITEKIPQHGRSGGGLFSTSGELVGVCVGHTELDEGPRRGVFAAGESIRALLDDHDLNAVIHRSELRMARRRKDRSPAADIAAPELPSSVVTTSRSRSGETTDPDAP